MCITRESSRWFLLSRSKVKLSAQNKCVPVPSEGTKSISTPLDLSHILSLIATAGYCGAEAQKQEGISESEQSSGQRIDRYKSLKTRW